MVCWYIPRPCMDMSAGMLDGAQACAAEPDVWVEVTSTSAQNAHKRGQLCASMVTLHLCIAYHSS